MMFISCPSSADTIFSFSRLHGESLLGKRNLENSSHAYDKGLLSKFGRPKTPPRSSTSGSVDTSPVSGTPFYQDRRQYPQLKALSISEGQSSLSSGSPFRVGSPPDMYNNSPRSIVVSPGLISTAASAQSYMEFRNPVYGNQSPPSSAIIPERRREHTITADDRCSNNRSTLTNLAVGASNASEAKRGSYEQPFFSEPDSDFAMEETGALRHLHLEDRHRTPPSMDSHNHQFPPSTDSRATGMKRRASSEATREEKAPLLAVGGNEQRRTSNHLSAHYNQGSPVNRFTPQHGSVSSQSSGGLMNGSYASSGLSLGSSSMTSISTHDRLSPSALSPCYDQHQTHDSSYINSIPIDPATQEPFPQIAHPDSSDVQPTMMAHQLPKDLSNQGKIPGGPQLQAHMHICACCPKKPKKFDTEEELRYGIAHYVVITLRLTIYYHPVPTPLRSNTSVPGVRIGSRTRTRWNVIKIHFTSAVTHGRVRHWATISNPLFILRHPFHLPISIQITQRFHNQLQISRRITTYAVIAVSNFRMYPPRTGTSASLISPTHTNSVNAISQRSFSVQITFVNT